MANGKSIRRTRQSDRAGGTDHRRIHSGAATSGRHREVSNAARRPEQDPLKTLICLALRFKAIYGTALAVELALRKQNAEQDADIAECLRAGVRDAIAEQDCIVRSLVAEMGGELPEPLP